MAITSLSPNASQAVPEIGVSDPQPKDQSLEVFVEQTVRELIHRIESEAVYQQETSGGSQSPKVPPEKRGVEAPSVPSLPSTPTPLITPLSTALAYPVLDRFGGLWDSKYRLGTLHSILQYYMSLSS